MVNTVEICHDKRHIVDCHRVVAVDITCKRIYEVIYVIHGKVIVYVLGTRPYPLLRTVGIAPLEAASTTPKGRIVLE